MPARAPGRAAAVLVLGVVAVGVVGAAIWFDRRDRGEAGRAAVAVDSIVLLGDSITEQGEWHELLPDRPVVNAGHSGFTTAQLVDVAVDVAAAEPEIVYVLAGTNDIRDSLPATTTAEHYRRLLDALAASPATTVVVQTVLPRADAPAAVDEINRELTEIAAERRLRVLDLHTPFDDGSGGLRPAETTDGVHLAAAGYERWAALLAADLDGGA
jgi:lysophospholipase L1-like esterase